MKCIPDALAPWLNVASQRLVTLGTDGFGRSDNREHLRRHFEVSAEAIAGATLSKLAREGKIKPKKAQQALAELNLDPETNDPAPRLVCLTDILCGRRRICVPSPAVTVSVIRLVSASLEEMLTFHREHRSMKTCCPPESKPALLCKSEVHT